MAVAATLSPPRKQFTRADVRRMTDAGVFEGERVELIEGDLISKMGQKPPHATAIRRIVRWLIAAYGADAVSVQLPIEVALGDQRLNEPEPDVAVFASNKPEFAQRHPRGDELTLLVEVADSSAAFDLTQKAALYARAGVPEYWVLDLSAARVVVHRQPRDGAYQSLLSFAAPQTVSPEGRPESIAVADLLP